MKVLLSSATKDAGCISLKRSIDYLSKQVNAIEVRIQELIFDETSMQKNYVLLSSLKGVFFGCLSTDLSYRKLYTFCKLEIVFKLLRNSTL